MVYVLHMCADTLCCKQAVLHNYLSGAITLDNLPDCPTGPYSTKGGLPEHVDSCTQTAQQNQEHTRARMLLSWIVILHPYR